MSVLGSLTQANPQSYFFALASQGPGAGIQSPASVIPDGTGNTTLALTATGTAGASAISVTGSAGVPGGSGAITVGGFGTVYRAAVLDNSGCFPNWVELVSTSCHSVRFTGYPSIVIGR